jgi:hypothetical protein
VVLSYITLISVLGKTAILTATDTISGFKKREVECLNHQQ